MTNPSALYQWIKENIDIESEEKTKEIDLINGLIHRFNLNRNDAINWIGNFQKQSKLMDNSESVRNEYAKYSDHISSDTDNPIDYSELYKKETANKRRMICHNCKKELNAEIVSISLCGEYCNDTCKLQYINSIILFWKPDIVTESETKEIGILQLESRVAFMSLVRNADPKEMMLRIKTIKHCLQEAYEIAYSALEAEKMKTEFEAEFTSKEISKRHSDAKSREKVESAELKREIDKVKKIKEKVNPELLLGAKVGHCLNCGIETSRETCSEKCKLEWKSISHMVNNAKMSLEAARAVIKGLNERSIQ